jgi:hypothetical protein
MPVAKLTQNHVTGMESNAIPHHDVTVSERLHNEKRLSHGGRRADFRLKSG